MQLARSILLRTFLLLVSTFAMGCLVTESISFPVEENLPPAVVQADPPWNRVVPVIVTPDTTEIRFAITIRDENVDQRLQWIADIDRNANLGQLARFNGQLEPTGMPERLLDLSIPTAILGSGSSCHRLDLRVSSEFEFSTQDEPKDPNDLDSVTWWLNVRPADEMGASLDACP
ncbi:MAG: hypothetical protein R3A78_00420 [Polyangiales bacterium]|nr:hypothetical protein [Myxococcales bacterium]